ncbi:uncharacterized protein LOC134273236 [Saccostrea cucullata]|uniref:uncharacterized protein LOC134273236 n=1 Tax=Saccostrea cuccullata TaxID=36930 RepID=UPI002ED1BAC2
MWCGKQVSLFLLWNFIDYTFPSLSCGDLSLKTMKIVVTCPSKEDEKTQLATNKNCGRYWNLYKHECKEDPLNFQYHCVINSHGNETIEVCAIKTKIHGFCTAFDVHGGIIKAYFGYDCREFDPPCEDKYNSTDAYLYKPCYNTSSKQSIGTSLRLELWTTKIKPHVSTMNSSKSSKRTLFHTGVQNEGTKRRYVEHESTNKLYSFTSIKATRFSSERPTVLVKSDVFWSGYIIYIIIGLVGLFVLFFGIFAFSFMHKNVFQRRNLDLRMDTFQKENTDYTPIQRNLQNRSSVTNTNGQETSSAYISPSSENDIHYEEITMINSSVDGSSLEDNEKSCEFQDDKNNSLDPSTYLTPIAETYLTPVADSENTYIEVVD